MAANISWTTIESKLRELDDRHQLDPQWVARVPARNLPRYAGDHEDALGNAGLLRDLETFPR